MAISHADPSGSNFPLLDGEGWSQTSPADPSYNCIAWAADENRRLWWPGAPQIGYWPPNVKDEPTLDAFEEAFALLTYGRCDSADLEEGFEKVAIYASEGEVTHAARQLPNGRWTSKLGKNIDIEHTLRGLEGPLYGHVVRVLKRPRPALGSGEQGASH